MLATPPHLLTLLRNALNEHFSVDEMRTLCFELGKEYENIPNPNNTREAYAREITLYFERLGQVKTLVDHVRSKRPLATELKQWDEAFATDHGLSQPTSPCSNPFVVRGRINNPAEFFGRSRVIREVCEDLRKMNSVAIIGGPQIGKSSLLYYLYATRANWLNPVKQGEVHYVDLQGAFNQADFCETILQKLKTKGKTPIQLKRTLEKRIEAGQDLVLLLDSIERLSGKDIDPRMLDMLRSLAQNTHLVLGVASRKPLNEVFQRPNQQMIHLSDFYNIFTERQLPPFSVDEISDFVQSRLRPCGLEMPSDMLHRLIQESQGNPALVQAAARAWFEQHYQGAV